MQNSSWELFHLCLCTIPIPLPLKSPVFELANQRLISKPTLPKPTVHLHPNWLNRARLSIMLVGLACVSAACSASDAQSAKGGKGGGDRAVPVVVATATQKTVPIFFRTTGTVQAYSTVSVKPQIDGQLNAVYFREGQEVRKGDPLFAIDPRPLQAALDEAIANQKKRLPRSARHKQRSCRPRLR